MSRLLDSLVDPRPVLVHTPLNLLARRPDPIGFIPSIFEQERNDTMSWDLVKIDFAYSGAIIGMSPQVLRSNVKFQAKSILTIRKLTLTEYCLPALIQGDSVRLKDRSAA